MIKWLIKWLGVEDDPQPEATQPQQPMDAQRRGERVVAGLR